MQGEWDITMGDGDEEEDDDQTPDPRTSESGIIWLLCTQTHWHAAQNWQNSRPSWMLQGDSRISGLTLQDLTRLLGGIPAGAVLASVGISARLEEDEEDDEDYEDEDDEEGLYHQSSQKQWFPPVTEPQKAGTELLAGGEFGRVANKLHSKKNTLNVSKFILDRTRRPYRSTSKEDYTASHLFICNPSKYSLII